MNSLDLPQILYQPFAATGDKNTILNSPSAEDPQRANLQTGFPAITQIPIENGGIPPERMDFNGLGYLLSSFYFFTQCGGVYTFNQDVSNAIGGYPLGAVLYYTDSGGTTYKVRSLLENNTYNFVTTPSYIDNEHWAYVSSTPITQDTSASSANNVFSTAAIQSLLNTVVHKTGNETISDYKTFESEVLRKGELSPRGITAIRTIDTNGKGEAFLVSYYSDTRIYNRLMAYNATAKKYGYIDVAVEDNGKVITHAQPSDENDSIVTTRFMSKSPTGYVKLGNGLIIQWGTFDVSRNYTQYTVTLPTPFSNTTYVVVATQQRTELNDFSANWHVISKETTTFTIQSQTSSMNWIAIGY